MKRRLAKQWERGFFTNTNKMKKVIAKALSFLQDFLFLSLAWLFSLLSTLRGVSPKKLIENSTQKGKIRSPPSHEHPPHFPFSLYFLSLSIRIENQISQQNLTEAIARKVRWKFRVKLQTFFKYYSAYEEKAKVIKQARCFGHSLS